ncbi:50S ribosomal protein L36, partial [Salmonella enterica subsp. enterica serovar Javiana]|nr:50S ribosomal protein L36 [Salmonella enterica subsp. enterica serovar Javiana]
MAGSSSATASSTAHPARPAGPTGTAVPDRLEAEAMKVQPSVKKICDKCK